MGKPKHGKKPARKKPGKAPAAAAPTAAPNAEQQATHLAIPAELAQQIRGVLGTLPHDQINDLLVRMAQQSRPVNLRE